MDSQTQPDIAALRFYLDCGINEALLDETVDRFKMVEAPVCPAPHQAADQTSGQAAPSSITAEAAAPTPVPLGTSEAYKHAVQLAKDAQTLDELREAILGFDGIPIKKTAMNMVFADGNPKAPIMLIGEAPGGNEDRQGQPFIGASGALMDKILSCIGLDRSEENPAKSVYISNILNWRPPGNRSPSPGEIDVSLPFIERHIQLIQPKIIILCGAVSAKALLGSGDSLSRLRKKWHEYRPQCKELQNDAPAIAAIATYHPSYLLQTPLQKKAVWADMLEIQAKHRDLNS